MFYLIKKTKDSKTLLAQRIGNDNIDGFYVFDLKYELSPYGDIAITDNSLFMYANDVFDFVELVSIEDE